MNIVNAPTILSLTIGATLTLLDLWLLWRARSKPDGHLHLIRSDSKTRYVYRAEAHNLLETNSLSWAHTVKIALEAVGLHAVVLDEHAHGIHAFNIRFRVAVADGELTKARSIVAQITPRWTGAPPSWRIQKRGLLLGGCGIVGLIRHRPLRRFRPWAPHVRNRGRSCLVGRDGVSAS